MKNRYHKVPTYIRKNCPLPSGMKWIDHYTGPGVAVMKSDGMDHWIGWATHRKGEFFILFSMLTEAYGPFGTLTSALEYLWLKIVHGDFQ